MRTVSLLPEAVDELSAPIDWYESRQSGLGDAFRQFVSATIGEISERPQLFPKALGPFHGARVRRFPYTLYYSIESEGILILAIYHGSRRPGRWVGRT